MSAKHGTGGIADEPADPSMAEFLDSFILSSARSQSR